ncbi:MAG: ABC transporter ATP-binding protein [Acidobacteria bacterium]|nr:ABC transporter ATP-binding protein [Acidobacteriota bacterium]
MIIQVEGLQKSYGPVEAVRGISFQIARGEVFGLLGPNGAGKTTTIEILEGLRSRDGGTVSVCGFDPGVETRQLKQRLGIQLQQTALPEKITVQEALDLFASFYQQRVPSAELLDRFGLTEKRGVFYDVLSGGQQQQLALALAMVNDPEVVMFDEPTAGLDPQTRREIYSLIARLKDERRTVLLTTHYIEEAELLCDRVAIVDHGKVIALGTPSQLIQQSQQSSRIEFALMRLLIAEDNEVVQVHLERPSLEDVFIELTGRSLRD